MRLPRACKPSRVMLRWWSKCRLSSWLHCAMAFITYTGTCARQTRKNLRIGTTHYTCPRRCSHMNAWRRETSGCPTQDKAFWELPDIAAVTGACGNLDASTSPALSSRLWSRGVRRLRAHRSEGSPARDARIDGSRQDRPQETGAGALTALPPCGTGLRLSSLGTCPASAPAAWAGSTSAGFLCCRAAATCVITATCRQARMYPGA